MSCAHAIHGNHCGHLTGSGSMLANGRLGFREAVCCWCGAQVAVPWARRQEHVPGHGPHHTVTIQTNEWPHNWESAP